MTVTDIARQVDGAIVAAPGAADTGVRGGYASDLLSDVMANAQDGDVWITLQKHVNIVAVAQLKNLAAIVIVNGRQAEAETAARASEHGIAIVATRLSAFEAAGRLYELGVRGRTVS